MSATRRQFSRPKPQKALKPVKIFSTAKFRHYFRRLFRNYGSRHLQAALQSLGQLTHTPITSAMIVIVIGIALTFPTSLFVLLKNAAAITQNWGGHSPIVLYLKMQVTQTEAQTLAKQLTKIPGVAKIDYISPEQGLTEFERQAGFSQMQSSLKDNPLPSVLVIDPTEQAQGSAEITALLTTLKQLPQVDTAQLDLQWVQRLNALIQLAKRSVCALATLFGVGIIFIVASTIHLATERHREEIVVYQLVGASNTFIRRPFLYSGVWYGLGGSLVACILVFAFFSWVSGPVQFLAQQYGSNFTLQGLSFSGAICLILLAIGLSWVGSWAAVYRHL
jgi:cell division transport system permease protein